jgi:hypothetical protein
VHYDGFLIPSEVKIESIPMWIMLYDLPAAMMKESYARQLGKFVKMDTRFPGYLRIRLDFLLVRALVLEMKVKIKGRGVMGIMLRYENVPHFFFSCGHIGHAAMSCTTKDSGESGIRYGEELRVSPPRRVREIQVKRTPTRATRQLFQVDVHQTTMSQGLNEPSHFHAGHARGFATEQGMQQMEGIPEQHKKVLDNISTRKPMGSVEEMQADSGSGNNSRGIDTGRRKDRVSFGTYMSTDEESSKSITAQ